MKLFSSVIFNLLLPGILCVQNVKTDSPESVLGKNLKQNTIPVNLLTHLAHESLSAGSESRLALAQKTLDSSPEPQYNEVTAAPLYCKLTLVK